MLYNHVVWIAIVCFSFLFESIILNDQCVQGRREKNEEWKRNDKILRSW